MNGRESRTTHVLPTPPLEIMARPPPRKRHRPIAEVTPPKLTSISSGRDRPAKSRRRHSSPGGPCRPKFAADHLAVSGLHSDTTRISSSNVRPRRGQ